MGKIDTDHLDNDSRHRQMSLVTAWAPYVALAVLLVLTRVIEPLNSFLTTEGVTRIAVSNILGVDGISTNVDIFYSPGFLLILVSVLSYLFYRMAGTAIALLCAVPLVRILIQSGINESGLDSMPVVLAQGVASVAGDSWPVFSPWIGALGAFIAGSNTVSNLTFSQFQWSTGNEIGVPPEKVVATQAVGGAGGNPVAVHNVVAASATVGLLGREGDLIRKTVLVSSYYCVAAGSIGYMLIHGIGLNLGTLLFVLMLGVLGAIASWMVKRDKQLPAGAAA
jgi:lactate permease